MPADLTGNWLLTAYTGEANNEAQTPKNKKPRAQARSFLNVLPITTELELMISGIWAEIFNAQFHCNALNITS